MNIDRSRSKFRLLISAMAAITGTPAALGQTDAEICNCTNAGDVIYFNGASGTGGDTWGELMCAGDGPPGCGQLPGGAFTYRKLQCSGEREITLIGWQPSGCSGQPADEVLTNGSFTPSGRSGCLDDQDCHKDTDPVDLSIGDYRESWTDLAVPGLGLDFRFTRTYHSNRSMWDEYRFPALRDKSEIPGLTDVLSADDAPAAGSDASPLGGQWSHSYFGFILRGAPVAAETEINDIPAPGDLYENSPTLILDDDLYWFGELEDAGTPGDTNDPVVWSALEIGGTVQYVEPTTGEPEEMIYYAPDGTSRVFELVRDPAAMTQTVVDPFNRISDGPIYRLSSIRDRTYTASNDTEIDIVYNDESMSGTIAGLDRVRIDYIVDTRGEIFDFHYVDDPIAVTLGITADQPNAKHLIRAIEHVGTNRFVEFEYDEVTAIGTVGGPLTAPDSGSDTQKRYLLTRVMLPEIKDDVTHGYDLGVHARFAGTERRAWKYAYTSDTDAGLTFDGKIRWRALQDTWDPNRDEATDPPLLTNSYEYDETSVHGPRAYVVKQDRVGEVYNYAYRTAGTVASSDRETNTSFLVWVNTRRGQVRRYEYEVRSFRIREVSADHSIGTQQSYIVARREYTGFAEDGPDLPSFESSSGGWTNEPISPLRGAGEPEYYVELFEYNDDWLQTSHTGPIAAGATGGDKVLTNYSNTDPERRMAPSSRTYEDNSGGTQDTISTSTTYLGGGSCCGGGFPNVATDGKGTTTDFVYDSELTIGDPAYAEFNNVVEIRHNIPSGGGSPIAVESFSYDSTYPAMQMTHTLPSKATAVNMTTLSATMTETRMDESIWETAGAKAASGTFPSSYTAPDPSWLRVTSRRMNSDADPANGILSGQQTNEVNLTTAYTYDGAGNVVKVVDPLGHTTRRVYNQANQLVRSTVWKTAAELILMSRMEYFYDANGNLVRTDEQVLNHSYNVVSGTRVVTGSSPLKEAGGTRDVYITTIHEYDPLNTRVRTSREIKTFGGTHEALDSLSVTTATQLDPGSMFAEDATSKALAVTSSGRSDFQKWFATTEYRYDGNRNLVELIEPIAFDENLRSAVEQDSWDAFKIGVRTITIYDARDLPFREYRGVYLNGSWPGFGDTGVGDETPNVSVNGWVDPYQNDDFSSQSSVAGESLVTEMDYDEKGRLVTVRLDPDNLTATATSTMTYDGFDRLKTMTDPMGNVTVNRYDVNHNLVSTAVFGAMADTASTSASNVLLSYTESVYDVRDRPTTSRTLVYEYVSPGFHETIVPTDDVAQKVSDAVSNSEAAWHESSYVYNANDSVFKTVSIVDEGAGTAFGTVASGTADYDVSTSVRLYDTASRLKETIDFLENRSIYEYDAGSRPVAMTSREAIPGTSSPVQTEDFLTEFDYDPFHRRIRTIRGDYGSGTGPAIATLADYDSRGNMIKSTDGTLDVTEISYDGLNRATTSRVVFSGGATDIMTTTKFDDSSRVISLIDDNLNETQYVYDTLSREITRTMADDGTGESGLADPDGSTAGSEDVQYKTAYDARGNIVETTDARGYVVACTHDLNNRVLTTTVTPGQSATPTISYENFGYDAEWFAYDGVGRVTSAINNHSEVLRTYDSRSLMLTELQNHDVDTSGTGPNGEPLFLSSGDMTVTYEYSLAGNEIKCTYPSGRVLSKSYDILNRLSETHEDRDANPLDYEFVTAQYEYVGRGRVRSRDLNDGDVTSDYSYGGWISGDGMSAPPAAGSAFRQMTSVLHQNWTGSVWEELDEREFDWDEDGNKIAHRNQTTGLTAARSRTFGYDEANRLTSSTTSISGTPDDYFKDASGVTYTLDGVHNRTTVTDGATADPLVGASVGDYDMWGTVPVNVGRNGTPADDKVNQYSRVPSDGAGLNPENGLHARYDRNGNLRMVHTPNYGDTNDDFSWDLAEVQSFLIGFPAGDPSADLNGDGIFDNNDVQTFLITSGTGFEYTEYSYDARDQLVRVGTMKSGTSDQSVQIQELSADQYRYDAFNRRTSKTTSTVDSGSTITTETHFYYGGQAAWQVLEEHAEITDDDGTTQTVTPRHLIAENVFGLYIDEVIARKRFEPGGPRSGADGELWYLQDDMYSVIGVTDSNGNIEERYEYGDYGQPYFLLPGAGTVRSIGGQASNGPIRESYEDNPYLFTGRRWEAETGLYQYRHRYYKADWGRFVHNDNLWTWDSMGRSSYCFSTPGRLTDPLGLHPSMPGRHHFIIQPRAGCDGLSPFAAEKYWNAVHSLVSSCGFDLPSFIENSSALGLMLSTAGVGIVEDGAADFAREFEGSGVRLLARARGNPGRTAEISVAMLDERLASEFAGTARIARYAGASLSAVGMAIDAEKAQNAFSEGDVWYGTSRTLSVGLSAADTIPGPHKVVTTPLAIGIGLTEAGIDAWYIGRAEFADMKVAGRGCQMALDYVKQIQHYWPDFVSGKCTPQAECK